MAQKLIEFFQMIDGKVIISLTSVFVGWGLAQVTNVLKDMCHIRKVKNQLELELDELDSELKRTLQIYTRSLQVYAKKGIDNGVATPLSNHIFKNYYKDVVLSLNKHQRISYQLIHTLIESINNGIKEFGELIGELQNKIMQEGSKSLSNKDIEIFGNKIKCEYINISLARWHVLHHLSNPNNPTLEVGTQFHIEYLKYIDQINSDIAELIENAKEIPRERFNRAFNHDVDERYSNNN